MPFQHTAARRRLDVLGYLDIRRSLVSTHSRPKAAVEGGIRAEVIESFNTQPPEGGCRGIDSYKQRYPSFNTQPPEGGCRGIDSYKQRYPSFNTQPPEGGCSIWMRHSFFLSSFNTQPPEGGCRNLWPVPPDSYCFNTQPPEGGWRQAFDVGIALKRVSTHSRPKAADADTGAYMIDQFVSTHSRPKAAARRLM